MKVLIYNLAARTADIAVKMRLAAYPTTNNTTFPIAPIM